MQGTELAELFSRIAQDLANQQTTTATLHETVRLAVQVVPGCDFAGVSWLEPDRRIETPACSDPIVARCDAVQYDLQDGPCVDAVWHSEINQVDDMATEARWPKFCRAAAGLGIGSMLAHRLATPHRTIGALNLYSRHKAAFDEQSRRMVTIYATHASIALMHRRLESDLRAAAESRDAIGQAIGILIERHRLRPAAAFDLLVKASQRRHVKLREIAAELVATGAEPVESADGEPARP